MNNGKNRGGRETIKGGNAWRKVRISGHWGWRRDARRSDAGYIALFETKAKKRGKERKAEVAHVRRGGDKNLSQYK